MPQLSMRETASSQEFMPKFDARIGRWVYRFVRPTEDLSCENLTWKRYFRRRTRLELNFMSFLRTLTGFPTPTLGIIESALKSPRDRHNSGARSDDTLGLWNLRQ